MTTVKLVRDCKRESTKRIVLKKRRTYDKKEVPIEARYVIGDISLPPYEIYEPEDYRDGPEGFIKWCEDNVCIPVYLSGNDVSTWVRMSNLPDTPYRKTGRSYKQFWENQKWVLRDCLRMVNNEFIYRLIILCWPRGEGKSIIAVLIQLWKFFNWTRQQIVLGANSKEQITFVHYDIMKDIIINSPNLLKIVGKRNILEKQIRLKDSRGNVTSVIRSISSFSGIVSNITGYTFSEIFDMKNPKFFTQLDGSIRNIPNALGVIDSTVSAKSHILYALFKAFVKKESKTIYFSYRYSKTGNEQDYWNPRMTQDQLNDYRFKFPLGEFEKYFLNLWGSASDIVFTKDMVDSMLYIGHNDKIGNFDEIRKAIIERNKAQEQLELLITKSEGRMNRDDALVTNRNKTASINNKLISVESYYQLTDGFSSCAAGITDLNKLSELFDTDWAILCGLDRADPMKESKKGARTIFTCVAKGLPGSKTYGNHYNEQGAVPNYLYMVLHVANVENHSTEDLKNIINYCKNEYDGIDSLCLERWGVWDIVNWAEDNDIKVEAVFPAYDKQKSAFSELFLAVSKGRLKSPTVYVAGSKENDILREEMGVFYHDSDKRWFGSTEKNEKYGIQDDSIFSLGWCLYGGRSLDISDFRERKSEMWFGSMIRDNVSLLGEWR